jgi:uncharacterized OsmC-like protein
MKIAATIENSRHKNLVTITTDGVTQKLEIPAKSNGYGSAVNGGELLFLALATCFCNDIYREAKKKNIQVTKVTVDVSGEFSEEGKPGLKR